MIASQKASVMSNAATHVMLTSALASPWVVKTLWLWRSVRDLHAGSGMFLRLM